LPATFRKHRPPDLQGKLPCASLRDALGQFVGERAGRKSQTLSGIRLLGTTNCATSGQEIIGRQRAQIEALQKQNEEFQQRLSQLEALIAQKLGDWYLI
jgi:hypothetical protein